MPKIYLAGAITGCSYDGCTDWREFVTRELATVGILGISPMRAKDFLKHENNIKCFNEEHTLSSSKGIKTRDHWDCSRADAIFMNLLGTTRVSIGTMIEAGWADAYRKPVILVMENDNLHRHPILDEIVGYRVETVEEGVSIAKALFCQDNEPFKFELETGFECEGLTIGDGRIR